MSKIYSVFTFVILVLFAASLTAQEVNVTGDWDFTMQTRSGESTITVKFVQEGEKLTVTMENPRGGETTGEGTVKGNEIEWTITRTSQRGEMTMTYKGTVEGDTMKGEVEFGPMGTVGWTATRKK